MFEQLCYKVNHFRKDKRGTMAIEIVVGMLLFVLILGFFVDLVTISWKFSVISQTNSYIARTAGLQGGVLPAPPDGFPGGNAQYVTSGQLYNSVKDKLNSAGIKDGDWTVTINGANLSAGTSVPVDYRQSIATNINMKYEWTNTSNLIPGAIGGSITSKRAVSSEFKYRYDSWLGE